MIHLGLDSDYALMFSMTSAFFSGDERLVP